jgi:hypothetical protein
MTEIRRTGGGPSGVPQTDSTAPVPDSPGTKDSTGPQQTAGTPPKPDPHVLADKLLELSIGSMAKVIETVLDGGPLKDTSGMEKKGGTPLESAPQILKSADELIQKAAVEVGKLPGELGTSGDPHRIMDEFKKL